MSESMTFDSLSLIEVPVKIIDKNYVLREASEDAACRWRNSQVSGAKMVDGKVSGLGNLADGEPLLVSLCLFELVPEVKQFPDGKPVPLQTVRSWPARVVKQLFAKAKEISGLSEGEESIEDLEKQQSKLADRIADMRNGDDPAKKEPSSTTAN